MKKLFLFIFIILNFPSVAISENLKFKKIVSLDKPWGSSFISKTLQEIIRKNLLSYN